MGNLELAVTAYERANQIDINRYQSGITFGYLLSNLSTGCQNISETYAYLGNLEGCLTASLEALDWIQKDVSVPAKLALEGDESTSTKLTQERDASAYIARAYELRGNWEKAKEWLNRALYLQTQFKPEYLHLYGLRGIWEAEYYQYFEENLSVAGNILLENIQICSSRRWIDRQSRSCSSLAIIRIKEHRGQEAEHLAQEALNLSYTTKDYAAQIEALATMGLVQKNLGNIGNAKQHLLQGLDIALKGKYRLHEIDLRLVLTELYMDSEQNYRAEKEIRYASELAYQTGYKLKDRVLTYFLQKLK